MFTGRDSITSPAIMLMMLAELLIGESVGASTNVVMHVGME